jgi:hypothetical protein
MPYTVTLLPIDFGGFIGLGPALSGTFVNVTPSAATDTATATAASPFTLAFMSATPPSPGVAALHVANSGPMGDLFRSGLVTGLPPSPGTLTVLSFPTALTSLSATAFTAMVSARIGSIVLTPPPWAVAAIGAASLGAYIPLGGAVTGVVPTLNATPPGTVTLTVTGFFTFQTYYFFTDTITFTATLVMAVAPSGDARQPSRILSVSTGATTLSTMTTGPSPTLATTGFLLSGIAPILGMILQPQIEAAIEAAINGAIDGLVAPGLASMGFLRSPSSVVSARSVTVTGSGMVLRLVLADLLGPAISPVPGSLEAAVSPVPQAGGQRVYTVTVTNAATGTPVNQADVTLLNYTANGTAQMVGPYQTNISGQADFNVALHPKITFLVNPVDHERTRVFHHPTLTISRAGFTTINLRLLQDPGDI